MTNGISPSNNDRQIMECMVITSRWQEQAIINSDGLPDRSLLRRCRWLDGNATGDPLVDFSNQHKEQRNEKDGEECRRQHAAEHTCPNGSATGSAGSRGDYQRKDAQNEGHRGHDYGAEAEPSSLDRRLDQRAALLMMLLARKLYNEDGILGGQSDQSDQSDLEVDVVIHASQPHRRQGSKDAEGHRNNHGKGDGPALVLRGEDQKHHEEAKPKRQH